MKRAVFDELMQSVEQALEHSRGRRELRTTILPPPPEPMTAAQVRRLRKRLNASQAVFARYLNVSTKLVQAWEADRRQPEGPALLLLRLGERDPAALTAAAFGVPVDGGRRPASAGRSARPHGATNRRARSTA